MKKVSAKKLSLSKETVTCLTNSALNNAIGGGAHRKTHLSYCTKGVTCISCLANC